MSEDNYIKINKNSWNQRVASHFDSAFYDVKGFLKGKTSLKSIELDLLENVEGKSILHLQCHFGQDTISLARRGATCTGVDLSDQAIEKARELNEQVGTNATFIEADIYDLPNHLDQQFDIVYTSYGTIGWLPDLDKWAKVIQQFLKPGGAFYFIEFHPVVWMFDDDFTKIHYNYFNEKAIIETYSGTYAEKEADLEFQSVSWNHSISEVMTALLNQNLNLESFKEYDYSPYDCFSKTIKIAEDKFRIEHLDNKIPMVYALKMVKD